jgi:short-subunit dehydrogenase
MKSLQGKVAVVTGAGSGIGRELAIQLAQKGARVAAVDRNPDTVRETVEMITGAQGVARHYVVDVSQKEKLEELAQAVQEDLGPADVVINNAGLLIKSERFDSVPYKDLQMLMDVNVWGVINCTTAFLPQLLNRPEASVVNLSSLGGLVGLMQQVPYATAKYAVRGFSEALRMDLYETPVHVTVVYPGPVATNIFLNSPSLSGEERMEAHRKMENFKTTTPSAAATKIIKGIQTRKARVLICRDTYIMDIVARLMPALYTRLLFRPVKKMMDVTTTGQQ